MGHSPAVIKSGWGRRHTRGLAGWKHDSPTWFSCCSWITLAWEKREPGKLDGDISLCGSPVTQRNSEHTGGGEGTIALFMPSKYSTSE